MISDFKIRSVRHAIEIVEDNSAHLKDLFIPEFQNDLRTIWFRGHENIKWKLLPTVMRRDESNWPDYYEYNLFTHFQLTNPGHSQTYTSTFDWLCLMQQYGLPTRLLDWTKSILVALYFAVLNEKRTKSKDGILYALCANKLNRYDSRGTNPQIYSPNTFPVRFRSEFARTLDNKDFAEIIKYGYPGGEKYYESLVNEKYWSKNNERLSIPIAVFPRRLNVRMISQESVYILFGGVNHYPAGCNALRTELEYLNEKVPCICSKCKDKKHPNYYDYSLLERIMNTGELYIECKRSQEKVLIEELKKGKDPFLIGFRIPYRYKRTIKRELERLGIHEGTLFPELEHQANYLRDKWRL